MIALTLWIAHPRTKTQVIAYTLMWLRRAIGKLLTFHTIKVFTKLNWEDTPLLEM
jgi:hypothetical protein